VDSVADQRYPFRDVARVPPPAVLFGERNQGAVRCAAGRPSGLGQQHQRQQSGHLAVVGSDREDWPGQPDRLPGQLTAGQIGPATGARHHLKWALDPQPRRPTCAEPLPDPRGDCSMTSRRARPAARYRSESAKACPLQSSEPLCSGVSRLSLLSRLVLPCCTDPCSEECADNRDDPYGRLDDGHLYRYVGPQAGDSANSHRGNV
jgi:hypothetical protein